MRKEAEGCTRIGQLMVCNHETMVERTTDDISEWHFTGRQTEREREEDVILNSMDAAVLTVNVTTNIRSRSQI